MDRSPLLEKSKAPTPPDDGIRLRVKEAARSLAAQGFWHLPGSVSVEDFMAICRALGKPRDLRDIAAVPGSRLAFQSSDALPLHTEPWGAALVGWFCVRQSAAGGATRLLDLEPVAHELPRRTLRVLSHIEVAVPAMQGRPPDRRTILQQRGNRLPVSYIPWLCYPASDDERGAMAVFGRYLDDAFAARGVTVRLQPGSVLLIDNHRILHGREAFAPEGDRLLRRLYLSPLQE